MSDSSGDWGLRYNIYIFNYLFEINLNLIIIKNKI